MKQFYLPEFVRCPICGEPLTREGGSLYCGGARRHTYDIAKEGYVNLLPPGRAKNARTGDGADMIRAREKFLSGGGYDRYSREAAQFAAGSLCAGISSVETDVLDGPTSAVEVLGEAEAISACPGIRACRLVDAGCGEGRHTVNMAEAVSRVLGVPVIATGFDASKYGVQAAAKRYVKNGGGLPQSASLTAPSEREPMASDEGSDEVSRNTNDQPKVAMTEAARSCDTLEVSGEVVPKFKKAFAVANIFSLPVTDGCADIFTSLFAPLPEDEARRVVRVGGILMICAAGPEHLHEMREVLYDHPIPSGGGAAVPQGFETVGEKMIEYPLALKDNEEIMSLFTMTPFYHNAPPEGRARLEAKESLTVTVQVKCTVARRLP